MITDEGNDLSSNVAYIAASYDNFAALKDDGSVVLWGNPDVDGSSISRNDIEDQLGSGVVAIHSNNNGFGILKNDGRAYF